MVIAAATSVTECRALGDVRDERDEHRAAERAEEAAGVERERQAHVARPFVVTPSGRSWRGRRSDEP